jgi:hypothetical protein
MNPAFLVGLLVGFGFAALLLTAFVALKFK